MSITTAEAVAEFIGVGDDATKLAVVAALYPWVERLVNKAVGWDLEQATHTEYYPKTERGGEYDAFTQMEGGRSDVLALLHKWVRPSGLVVYEQVGAYAGQVAGAFGSDTVLTLGSDYILELDTDNVCKSGHVRRLGRRWPKQIGSVKVTYTAGFTAAEFAGTASTGIDASDLVYGVNLSCLKAYVQIMAQQPGANGGASGVIVEERVGEYMHKFDSFTQGQLVGMKFTVPVEAAEIFFRYKSYSIAV